MLYFGISAILKTRQLLHTTYRLYMIVVLLQVGGLIFLCSHYARYGYDGVGFNNSKLIGKFTDWF